MNRQVWIMAILQHVYVRKSQLSMRWSCMNKCPGNMCPQLLQTLNRFWRLCETWKIGFTLIHSVNDDGNTFLGIRSSLFSMAVVLQSWLPRVAWHRLFYELYTGTSTRAKPGGELPVYCKNKDFITLELCVLYHDGFVKICKSKSIIMIDALCIIILDRYISKLPVQAKERDLLFIVINYALFCLLSIIIIITQSCNVCKHVKNMHYTFACIIISTLFFQGSV